MQSDQENEPVTELKRICGNTFAVTQRGDGVPAIRLLPKPAQREPRGEVVELRRAV